MSNQNYTQDKFNISQPIPGKDQQKPGADKQDQNKQPSGMPDENQRHRDSDCK